MAASPEPRQASRPDVATAAAFTAVEDRLRRILQPLRSKLVATRDRPGDLALEIPGLEGKPWGYVAGLRRGKRYVSYYLMAVCANPEIARSMSPQLRRRTIRSQRELAGRTGSRHWHLRVPGRPGTLELNAWQDRVWVNVHPLRDGGWATVMARELSGLQLGQP